ncbi:MAG: flavin reductase family protein [Actinomycetota bacterium]
MAVTTEGANKVSDFHEDETLVRRTFAQFPSGVSVLSIDHGGEKHALVVSSFMVGVSLNPCLVAVAIQKKSQTWPIIRQAETIGVSIFANGQGPLTRQLAGKDRAKRFDRVAVDVSQYGAVYIEDAAMWLETRLFSETDAGDHWMVLLQVTRLGVDESTDPLLWHGSRFREFASETSFDVE